MKKGETNPNKIIEKEDHIVLLIKSRGVSYECLLDKEDYARSEIKNNRWTISHPKYKYIVRGQWDGKRYHTIRLSRLLCGRVVLTGEVVDHINGNPLDNRRENLRITTQHNNTRNRCQIKNKTGVPGGHFSSSGKIRVNIRPAKGTMVHVGTFKTQEEAINARIEAEKKHWGHSFLAEKML